MTKTLFLIYFLSLFLAASEKEGLRSKHNQKLLAPVQQVLQNSSAVITNSDRVSLGYGCLITSEGHIFTKASLIEGQEGLLVRLGKKEYPAEFVESSLTWDVALLKIEITNSPPLQLTTADASPGAIVSSNGVTSLLSRRLKFGVIAANTRLIPMQEARLDLQAYYKKDQGFLITELKPEGQAISAGLQKDDLIYAIDDTPVDKSDLAFHELFKGRWPGEEVTLKIKRNDQELKFALKLLWLHQVTSSPQDRNEAMSGRTSTRRTGFPMVIQHDIPLSARTVGGPLLNLSGDCIGMNIARFSRSETYAIPAEAMVRLMEDWGIAE